MIDKYIIQVCEILGIVQPIVSFDKSHFKTSTTLAQCSSDGNTIFVNLPDAPDLDVFFAISHELRHVWQIRTNRAYYFDNYIPPEAIDQKSYNMQPAEIDANAFSVCVMSTLFGIAPDFKGLPDDVRDCIFKRAEEIALEL